MERAVVLCKWGTGTVPIWRNEGQCDRMARSDGV